MKERPKEPFVPPQAEDTVRQSIAAELLHGPVSARELSGIVRVSEKEVYGHLEHIRLTTERGGRHFVVTPAECRKCGFVFAKRGRLTRPGRCPVCRGESIHEPLFAIDEAARESR